MGTVVLGVTTQTPNETQQAKETRQRVLQNCFRYPAASRNIEPMQTADKKQKWRRGLPAQKGAVKEQPRCDYDAEAGPFANVEAVPASGCVPRGATAPGVDFMTGGLPGQVTQDISASWPLGSANTLNWFEWHYRNSH